MNLGRRRRMRLGRAVLKEVDTALLRRSARFGGLCVFTMCT